MAIDESHTPRTEAAQHDVVVDDFTSDELEAIVGGGPSQNGYYRPD